MYVYIYIYIYIFKNRILRASFSHGMSLPSSIFINDSGIFLPNISCYDQVAKKWAHPFGKLPIRMDHLSIVVVPKAVCRPQDPARVLVFNFRTVPINFWHSTYLAMDGRETRWRTFQPTKRVIDIPLRIIPLHFWWDQSNTKSATEEKKRSQQWAKGGFDVIFHRSRTQCVLEDVGEDGRLGH